MTTYYGWLTDIICDRDHPISKYGVLLRALYFTEYVWPEYIPLDENRASNGLFLRSYYERSSDCIQDPVNYFGHLDGRCSILEMIIALVRDMEYMVRDVVPGDNLEAEFFWKMIGNLGLLKFTNDYFDTHPMESQNEISAKIDWFLNHDYELNGEGGLFILREERDDAPTAELWWMANLWVMQEYGNWINE